MSTRFAQMKREAATLKMMDNKNVTAAAMPRPPLFESIATKQRTMERANNAQLRRMVFRRFRAISRLS